MGRGVLGMPHQAGVNFVVIGNVLAAKAEGVLVTGMLGKSAPSSHQRQQKRGGYAFQNDLHFSNFLRIMDFS
jgi:hypothetical protein